MAATAVAHEVDDDVPVEFLAIFEGQSSGADDGLGVIAVDVEDRGVDRLGDVRAVERGTRRGGGSGEPDLVVDDDVDRPAGAVAAQLGEVERLGDHALTGECCIAVDEDRQHGETGLALVDDILLGAHDALEDRVDGFEVAGVGRDVDAGGVSCRRGERTLGAQVVLHIARALDAVRGHGSVELTEDLRIGLAGDVREHIEATAVGHADGDLVEAGVGGLVEDLVEQDDRGLSAFEAEALLSDVLRLQEGLEGLSCVEATEDVSLLRTGEFLMRDLDLRLEPATLDRVGDMHVFEAGGPAVALAQQSEDVAEGHHRLRAEAAGGELAFEIPQGQTVLVDIEVRVGPLTVDQGIDIGHEVAARAVGIDEFDDACGLVDVVLVFGRDVGNPADRLVGQTQGFEDVVVEAVFAQQVAVDELEELARTGALDHAVIVGRSQGQHLGHGQGVDGLLAGALELGGVVERADADDAALALGQTRHGVDRADSAGVGQRDGGASEVVGGELALSRLVDEAVVGVDELAEGQRLRLLDVGHQQSAGPVLLRHVDGEAEVDMGGGDHHGLAVADVVGDVLRGEVLQGADHGEADEVGEGDLSTTGALEVRVDDDPVVDERLGRQGPDRGGGRDFQRLIHVLGDELRGAAQGSDRLLRCGLRCSLLL